MNTKESFKKQKELIFLESFLISGKLEAKIIKSDEKPDFLILYNGQKIGLEVTEIFISEGSKTLQAKEAKATNIIAKAQRFYQSQGGQPVLVNVVFHPGHNLSETRIDATANILASFVASFRLSEGEVIEWRPEEAISPLPDEISYVCIRHVPEESMAHWGVAGAGWVASLSASVLQKRIDAKKKLLPHYTREVDAHWLVIVANQMKPSQMFKMPDNLNELKIQSPFSRTFFYPYPENRIYELLNDNRVIEFHSAYFRDLIGIFIV